MIDHIVQFALRQRFLMLILVTILVVAGRFSCEHDSMQHVRHHSVVGAADSGRRNCRGAMGNGTQR